MLSADFDIEEVLAKISVPDKIKLLGGLGWWHTHPVPEVGIPSIRMSDGPNGVRGTRFFNGIPSSCFPSSTGLGSSFDLDLAYRVGQALGHESRAKGAHVLLAPTVNIQRSPLGGRGFESFSEDPTLSGLMAGSYISGLQNTGVAATIKHYVTNDQEFERFSISSELSERALREIYLKPFQIAMKEGKPWALMTAYNRINGIHASENFHVLDEILQKEWGFDGLIMSDWTGVFSTVESMKAGLDIEMPGPATFRGATVNRALAGQKLFMSDVDARIRKILSLLKRAYESKIPFDAPEEPLDTPEQRKVMREAAASAVVLLKNDAQTLPINSSSLSGKTVAVIGPNAAIAMFSGGGSARLLPTYTVSPLQGIKAAAEELGAKVVHARGASTAKFLITLDRLYNKSGALMEFWNNEPAEKWLSPTDTPVPAASKPVWATSTTSADTFLADGVDGEAVDEICWISYKVSFTADESGEWEFGLTIAGAGNAYLDGKLLIDLSTSPERGGSFFGLGTIDARARVPNIEKGKTYELEIRSCNKILVVGGAPFTCRGGLRLGGERASTPEQARDEALTVAKDADIHVLVIGLNHDFESEGFDRSDMELPGATNALVSAMLSAHPNTIIVNQSGTPVAMPWIDDAKTLVQAFYGGNELGNGLADVLFGKVNPSGKLALTFPKRLEDNPSYTDYGNTPQEHGKVYYNEGVFVGYRGFEIKKVDPLFPFGFGLSYTTFDYSKLAISEVSSEGSFSVTFTVTNTGKVAGSEAALVFISDVTSSLPRPVKELGGFTKVALQPGESKSLTVQLDRRALSFWEDRRGRWLAEAGKFEVMVAASAADVRLRDTIELKQSIEWLGL